MQSLKLSLLGFLLTIVVFQSRADQKVDYLIKKYHQAKSDSVRLSINNEIIWKYLFTDKARALQYIKKSESLAKKSKLEFGYVTLLGIKGIYFDVNGYQDSAQFYFKEGLRLSRLYKMPLQEEYALNNLGMYYWNSKENEKALYYFFESLRINDSLKGKKIDRSNNYSNIGLIYQDMALYNLAIKYHEKSLAIRQKSKDSLRMLNSYVNLGICYEKINKLDLAMQFYQQGISMSEDYPGRPEYYKFIEGIAQIHLKEGRYEESLQLNLTSLNRPKDYPISNNEQQLLYARLTELLVRLDRLKEAIVYGESGLKLTTNLDNPNLLKWLSIAYIKAGKANEGYDLMEKYYASTTEKFKELSAASLQEMKIKYETEKTQRTLAESKVAADRKQILYLQIIGISGISLFVLILIVAWQKRRNNKLSELQILTQLQFDLNKTESLFLQKQKIARDLHDNVGSQLTFIVSSMDNLLLQQSKGEEFVREKIQSLSSFTRKAILEMRDMLWGMKSENVSIVELQERILSFINLVNGLDISINLTLDFSDEIEEDLNLGSSNGIHILRFIQEAVNNAVKHSRSSEIIICITKKESAVLFEIKDNGCGFNLDDKIKQGNGMKSMSFRASALQAEMLIKSNHEGTNIELLLPVNNH